MPVLLTLLFCSISILSLAEEIGTLSLVFQLLTTFLLKERVTDRDQELVVRLNTILDTQDAYIYAIEQETYELLYRQPKDPGTRFQSLNRHDLLWSLLRQAEALRDLPADWRLVKSTTPSTTSGPEPRRRP